MKKFTLEKIIFRFLISLSFLARSSSSCFLCHFFSPPLFHYSIDFYLVKEMQMIREKFLFSLRSLKSSFTSSNLNLQLNKELSKNEETATCAKFKSLRFFFSLWKKFPEKLYCSLQLSLQIIFWSDKEFNQMQRVRVTWRKNSNRKLLAGPRFYSLLAHQPSN